MSQIKFTISGQLVDIPARSIYPVKLTIANGHIERIEDVESAPNEFILPGFIDAHIHIESSMVTPRAFARTALRHGTVATVSDPHEIANVLGIQGVEYMLDNAKGSKLKFHFGAPSCVPATAFETAGAELGIDAVRRLLERPDIHFLSEMMNYPGVLSGQPLVMEKIQAAHDLNMPVDGHAPGLKGELARQYVEAGITTDHECFTLEEALDKLSFGMKIIIREGSAAKNFDALQSLIKSHTSNVMFCSDDKHPDDLLRSHINELVVRSVEAGHDVFDALQCACINPVNHYNLNVGLLREGDQADFIIVEDLKGFAVRHVYLDGEHIVGEGEVFLEGAPVSLPNRFSATIKNIDDFHFRSSGDAIPVIRALDGELITRLEWIDPPSGHKTGQIISISRDILKIAVVNRYTDARPAVGFIRGFGLKRGALASTVAHDSHNIVAVGTNDADLCSAVNLLIRHRGGLALADGAQTDVLPLPIAGLMSPDSVEKVGSDYEKVDSRAKQLGCRLKSPFMTLSFMALLVIPEVKMSDKGIFDAVNFEFF